MATDLKHFLIETKFKLLDMERRATSWAKDAITSNIQLVDSILIFLSTKQAEEDMAKLVLTTEKQLRSLEDLKPRQENAELTEAILEVAEKLKPGTYLPLNNLPAEIKLKSVSSKIYGLRDAGKLPISIKPIQRGRELYLAKLTDEQAKAEEEKEKRTRRSAL